MQIIKNGRHDVIDKHISLFCDIDNVSWWFLVIMQALSPNPVGAGRETLRIT